MIFDNINLKCPECSTVIDINEHISHQMSQQVENQKKELESQLRKNSQVVIEKIKKESERKDKLLQKKQHQSELKDLEIKEMKLKFEDQETKIKIERKKAALEAKEKVAAEFKLKQDEIVEQKTTSLQLQIKELEDRQRQMVENHKIALKNATQGSMQTQGEGGELLIEEILRQSFPNDEIEEVKKGTLGADCIQKVKNSNGEIVGKIVWESKRQKHWKSEWISKVIKDTHREKGDFSIIVSEILPKNVKSMEAIDDSVWVCTFDHVKAMAALLRVPLLHTATALVRNQNKESKSIMLYEFMTGPEFNRAMKLIYDSYVQDITDIATEKRSYKMRWNSRQKQAEMRLDAMTSLMGSLSIIANENPAMKNLRDFEEKLLPNKGNND